MLVVCLVAFALPAAAMQADLDLPDTWGAENTAKRPATSDAFNCIEPEGYLLMPRAHITVGHGQVDPATYLNKRRAGTAYILRSPLAGIIEFLIPVGRHFRANEALARLYDSGILPDLREAAQAARRWRDQPYTVLPPARQDFPPPVVQRDSEPDTEARSAAEEPAESRPQPISQGGLQEAPATGDLARQLPVDSAETRSAPSPDLTELESHSDRARADVGELKVKLKDVEDRISSLVPRLQMAEDDLRARERLYEKGLVARNTVTIARDEVKELSGEMKTLRDRRGELQASLAEAADRLDGLQKKIAQAKETARQAGQPAREKPAVNSEPPSTRAPAVNETVDSSHSATTRPEANEPEREYPEPMVMPEHAPHSGGSIVAPSSQEPSEEAQRRRAGAIPRVFTHLNAAEWDTVSAPSQGVVLQRHVADGDEVAEGEKLLSIANTGWARIYAEVTPEALADFHRGAPVTITFEQYPNVRFEGWIEAIQRAPNRDRARVQMCVVCAEGYHADDAYATISWLSRATPLDAESGAPLDPHTKTEAANHATPNAAWAIFPVAPPEFGPGSATETVTVPGQYVGHIEAAQLSPNDASQTSGDARARLKQLAEWRKSFTDNMTTTIFDNQLVLTYPQGGAANRAVEKMVTGRVSHVRNRCARTMAEAVGFALGDAADWAGRLPACGYVEREDGVARPGDILVWPYTYGPRNTQHIGIAVLQSGRLMLLSNLAGRLGTTSILPGYRAFYRPDAAESESADSGEHSTSTS